MLGASRGAKLSLQHDDQTVEEFGLMTFGRSHIAKTGGSDGRERDVMS
jgi:hypothetical protein